VAIPQNSIARDAIGIEVLQIGDFRRDRVSIAIAPQPTVYFSPEAVHENVGTR